MFSVPATDTAAAGIPGAVADGQWLDVDGPIEGALTVEWRALTSSEFVELSTLANTQAVASLRAEDADPEAIVDLVDVEGQDEKRPVTASQKLARALLVGLAARRSVVAVHGAPDEVKKHLAVPSRIVGMLSPQLATEHGNRVMNATLSPDPFVRAASGR